MKKTLIIATVIYSFAFSAIANGYLLLTREPRLLFLLVPVFILLNLLAGCLLLRARSKRLKICCHGAVLLSVFVLSAAFSVAFHIVLAFRTLPDDYLTFVWSALLCIGLEAILFWNGIICVYVTSRQLGIKQRVVGIICGLIPVANLIVLIGILKTVFKEVLFETEKEELNRGRSTEQVCKTKYPILLVHGVFFRDSEYFNYWGRIPKELEQNGAAIYYGNHQSASSVADSGAELTRRIRKLVEELDCGKVNIIAHSKGGLDCRYAISKLGAAPFVASLTTVNTPHRGCLFADYLLKMVSAELKLKVASVYNAALKKLGDENPDFLAAVNDLTAESCAVSDVEMTAPQDVFCQSVGSILSKAGGGQFPLNFSYHLVKHFSGANDGLVSESSFGWGERYTLLTAKSKRGISHADVIDLNRQDLDGFDVREFYVRLVSELKAKGF